MIILIIRLLLIIPLHVLLEINEGLFLYEWCTKEIDKDKVIESSYQLNIEIMR